MPQLAALMPVGWPVMTPPSTLIDPFVPRIGPATEFGMVWSSPLQAEAVLGAPNVASATIEAPASSAARVPLAHAAVNGDWKRTAF
jgi:hypothetical protein